MTSILPGISTPDPLPLSEVPRARIIVLRSAEEAVRCADALLARDIEAVVEIDDAQRALPGQSMLPGVLAFPGSLFAYPLTVPVTDRERATRILEDLDDDAEHVSPRVLVVGAAIALVLGVAAVALRVALE